MQSIPSLYTAEGRAILRDLYKTMRFERQTSSLKTLYATLIVALNPSKLTIYKPSAPEITNRNGLLKGLSIWMQEIVNRYYYSTINSFVYFGAAVLLIIVGLSRFTDTISPDWIITGIIFEAILLFFVFITMYFTPQENDDQASIISGEQDLQDELLEEIGEIGRDMAAISVQFEKITKQLETHNYNASNVVSEIRKISISLTDLAAPNPEMIDRMKDTNVALSDFSENLKTFGKSVDILSSELIEDKVRKELSRILETRLRDEQERQ